MRSNVSKLVVLALVVMVVAAGARRARCGWRGGAGW